MHGGAQEVLLESGKACRGSADLGEYMGLWKRCCIVGGELAGAAGTGKDA